MVEPKISLSFLVPGAKMLSSQWCEENPTNSYDTHHVNIEYTKGSGKKATKVRETLVIKTRKPELVTHNINMSYEAYEDMLRVAPTEAKILPKKWKNLPEKERLKRHFDLIAHDLRAVSYSYEILGD